MLELRPTCEHCNKPLPPTQLRPASAPMNAPFVSPASKPYWATTFAQIVAVVLCHVPFAPQTTGKATIVSAKTLQASTSNTGP